MSQLTQNTAAFIEAEQFSDFVLMNLHDGLVPDVFYRNVSDFGEGTTLTIKSVGAAQVQDVSENVPLTYNPIDTGTVNLTITEYVGDAWFITDVLRQDGSQIEVLLAQRALESTRALQENFETVWFQAANDAQVATNANNVNSFAHRFVATGTNETFALTDLSDMKLSFDKANVPAGGRIGIVDPVVGTTLERLFSLTTAADKNPQIQGLMNEGFARDHQFVMNIFGFDIMTSNRLPEIASEQIGGSGPTVTNGIANIFMSVADDNTKPIMVAWRQMPKTETERNKDHQRDEFLMTARWGVGAQRIDTLGVILTDASAVE